MRKIVALRDLEEKMGWPWSPAQTWRMIAKGSLPKPFYLKGSRLALFYVDEINPFSD